MHARSFLPGRDDVLGVAPEEHLRPVIAVVGALFYSEPLDALVFLGAALIFAGNWINISRSAKA